jgi:enamine deaminase RidA (YjgF/YER057c/UK114 family)
MSATTTDDDSTDFETQIEQAWHNARVELDTNGHDYITVDDITDDYVSIHTARRVLREMDEWSWVGKEHWNDCVARWVPPRMR